MTGDRVFMNDYEIGAGIEVTQMIVYPTTASAGCRSTASNAASGRASGGNG